jgi:DNA adenine methylase
MSIQPHSFTSPLRYPGGKAAIADFVKSVIVENSLADGQYIELYAGGAGVAWPLLFEEYVQSVVINDISRSLYAFWHSVLNDTDSLCKLIYDVSVTMHEWHYERSVQENQNNYSLLELGFSTFFLNRTNRSGILRGGVIGGKAQNGKWKLDARFNKEDLIERIQWIARYSSRIRLFNLDATYFIEKILPNLSRKALVYLDPPYYLKGHELYEDHYCHDDHVNLARVVSNQIRQPWIVSYDAVPEIMELYERFRYIQYDLKYSAQEKYTGTEIMFFADQIIMPSLNNHKCFRL